jgi:ribosomal protein S3
MIEGAIPAQTLKADIDYAEEVAQTNDAGLMGVKVWVYKGDQTDIEGED